MNLLQRFRDWRKRKQPKPRMLSIGDTFYVTSHICGDYSHDCDVFKATHISDPLVLARRVASGSVLRKVGELLTFNMDRWNWFHVNPAYVDAVNEATKGPTDDD